MTTDYLRSKEHYRLKFGIQNISKFVTIIDSFGHGTYWSIPDGHSGIANYEIWLTPEEMTILKMGISDINFYRIF